MVTTTDELRALRERVRALMGGDDRLDVAVEVAPNGALLRVRANVAGTKVTYTISDGGERTVFGADLTDTEKVRAEFTRRLTALIAQQEPADAHEYDPTGPEAGAGFRERTSDD